MPGWAVEGARCGARANGETWVMVGPVSQRMTPRGCRARGCVPGTCRVFPLKPCSSPVKCPGQTHSDLHFTDEAPSPAQGRALPPHIASGGQAGLLAPSGLLPPPSGSLKRGPENWGRGQNSQGCPLSASPSPARPVGLRARLTHRNLVLGGAIWPFSCSPAGHPLPGRPAPLLQTLGAGSPLAASPALRSFHLLSFQSQHHPCPLLRPGLCSEEEDCQQALSFLRGGAGGSRGHGNPMTCGTWRLISHPRTPFSGA